MTATEDFTLANGMRFIVDADDATPAVTVGVWVRAGVCEEPADRRGIAHLLEHMMFRGSESVGPQEHDRRIRRVGGRCNAFTSFDAAVYFETVPAHALEEVFTLEADRFQRLRIAPDRFEVERKVVLEEFHAYMNQPIQRAFREMIHGIAAEHPYGIDPLGREEDLRAATAGDLEAYHAARYRPDSVFCVVAGNTAADEVRALAENHFGAWRADGTAAGPDVGRFEARVGSLKMRVPLQVPAFARVHRLLPARDEDVHALQLLRRLVSAGESSPLYDELVRRRRLCVDAGHVEYCLARGGVLVFYGAFLPPGRNAPRRRIARDVCDRLAEEGPDADEFARHLKKRRTEMAREAYSTERRMRGLGHAELSLGDYRIHTTELDALAAVTPARVRDLAARMFHPDNTLELDVAPTKQAWWLIPVGLLRKVWPL